MSSFDPEGKMQQVREQGLHRGKSADVDLGKATCHPQRKHYMKGFCRECYNAQPALVRERDIAEKRGLLTVFQESMRLQRMAEDARAEVKRIEGMAAQAKEILRERLPDYARLHWEAAQMAALRGDARPTEWALQSIKDGKETVVEAPAKVASAGEGGVKVIVGVQLSGLQPALGASNVVEAISVPTSEPTD